MQISLKVFIAIFIFLACVNIYATPTGITYKQYSPDNITIVHTLTIDPSKNKIIAARAQDVNSGLDTVANIAQHFKAVAAINGGFFKFDEPEVEFGLPAGILKINNQWYGIAFKPRGAIGWDPKTNQVLMDRLQTKSKLIINNVEYPIHAMNRIAKANKGYLLSDSYIEQFEVAPHTAITIKNNLVTQVSSSGMLHVPEGGYIYHSDPKLLQSPVIQKGAKAQVQIQVVPVLKPSQGKQWDKMPYIVGGGPLLIVDNKVLQDFSNEIANNIFLNKKHARTAIGILPNKNWVLVVVEQQFLTENTGMTIEELAHFMHSIGCIQALNLDGGSSSSMYLDAKINANFNFMQRPVADAILVVAK